MSPVIILARKEAGELVFSPRGIAWLLTTSAALSVFALLLVGSTELSLLDNAEVVYDMAGLVTALGALLAIVVGNDSIAGERERGSLIPLLLTPMSSRALVTGKIGGLAVAWVLMLLIALPYFWAVGSTGQNLITGIVGVGFLGTPVVLGFGLFALGLAPRLSASRSSLIAALIALLVSSSPLLIGASLRQSAVGRVFDAINPFSAAANAFDAVIIDSEPLSAQAGRLGLTIIWLAITAWFALSGVRHLTR
ncbi:MAG TPA: ABC transporter permease subunit [Dongiaceae bacterium]|nr:ABC transporter permease subunit [Dongiaceae bacterium]